MKLSEEQRSITEAPDGHYLVIASAGSGKTRVLTERIRYLLEVREIRSRILALTFTNKAAEEMRQRLQTLPDLQESVTIGTIHCFCQTILEAHGRVVGYETMPAILEREADRISMLEAAFDQSPELRRHLMRHDDPQAKRKFLGGVLEKISVCKRDWELYQKISTGDWTSDREAQAFREYQDHLSSQGVIDFDDILLLALRILSERPAIASIYQRSFRYLCVDEAQDLNAVQYALIRCLGEQAASILMVGDPNQAIYGFNGSCHRFMTEGFSRDFKPTKIVLRQNYRSSQSVIRAANALYPGSNEVGKAALEGEALLVTCADETAEAEWVTTKILSLLEQGEHCEIEGGITLDRIVVLARNRFVFNRLQESLQKRCIDYHLRQTSGGAALDSEVGKVLDLAVRLVINPRNLLVVGQICQLLGTGSRPQTMGEDGIALISRLFDGASDSWRPWLDPLRNWLAEINSDINRFGPATRTLESEWNRVSAGLENETEQGAQALADLKYLKEIWANYIRNVARDNRSLAQFRNQMATGETLPHLTGKGLMLAPVHTVKGLEFDIVFLIGMVEGTFPDYRAVRSGGAALNEEKNDAFVAVTRAKRLLYLTWPEKKLMPWDRENLKRQTRSRYFETIARELPSACVVADLDPNRDRNET